MKRPNNFVSILKNISYLSMLTSFITLGISLNVAAPLFHDRIDDQIEVTQDAEDEKESSESEISDNFEMDDSFKYPGKKGRCSPLGLGSISPSNSGIDLEHHLDINTPPPEATRG